MCSIGQLRASVDSRSASISRQFRRFGKRTPTPSATETSARCGTEHGQHAKAQELEAGTPQVQLAVSRPRSVPRRGADSTTAQSLGQLLIPLARSMLIGHRRRRSRVPQTGLQLSERGALLCGQDCAGVA